MKLTDRPSGMQALAPNGLKGALGFRNPGQSGIAGVLKDALTGLSSEFGEPLGITSGYRSPAYNRSVGGARQSLHTKGLAVDIDMTGWSTEQRQKAIQELTQRGVTGFIAYSRTPNMLHVDMRARPKNAQPHFMFDRTAANMARAPDYFKEMARLGGIKTPSSVNVPAGKGAVAAEYGRAAQTMQEAGVRGIGTGGQSFGAPVGPVSRSPLGAVSARPETMAQEYGKAAQSMSQAGIRGVGGNKSQTFGNMLSGMENPMYGPGQVVPASKPTPSRQNVARAYKEYAVTRALAPKTSPVTTASVPPDLSNLTISRNPFETMQTPVAPVVAPVPTPKPPAQVVPQPIPAQVAQQRVARPAQVRPSVPVLSPMNFRNALGFNAVGPVNRSVFGYGGQAIDQVLGGAGTKGSTAFSRSNPNVSYTALGNGTVAKHNALFGTTEFSYAGPNRSLFGGGGFGGFGSGQDASDAEANQGGGGVTSGGTGLW